MLSDLRGGIVHSLLVLKQISMKTLTFQVVYRKERGRGKGKLVMVLSLCLLQNGEVLPLKIVTYTTVSISLVALLITFILLVLIRTLRSNLHSIHKNLVAALFFSELVFLIGINQTENPVRVTLCLLLVLSGCSCYDFYDYNYLHLFHFLFRYLA